MLLDKKFRCRGSLWNEIRPETNESMKNAGYVIIQRDPSYSVLKTHGQQVTAIDVKTEELPKRLQIIAHSIVMAY